MIGKIIRVKRKELGLSQEELSAKIGCSVNTISNWERGVTRPDDVNCMALAEILQCCESELILARSGNSYNPAEKTTVVTVESRILWKRCLPWLCILVLIWTGLLLLGYEELCGTTFILIGILCVVHINSFTDEEQKLYVDPAIRMCTGFIPFGIVVYLLQVIFT